MRILLPVNESELALDAVHHALTLRRKGLRFSVVLVNVQEAPHLYEMVLAPDPVVLEGASEGAGHHALQPALAVLAEAGLGCSTDIGHGDPGRVLLEMAERHGCDAIVMGAGRASLLNPGRLGPVALAVLHHAAVPVTIVRHPDEADRQEANAPDAD